MAVGEVICGLTFNISSAYHRILILTYNYHIDILISDFLESIIKDKTR